MPTPIDLQGLTKKGPRGLLRKSFEDCVMFHLLTVSPNNVAEQERYYITNVLKKPRCVSTHQFVQRVEQLNSYILHIATALLVLQPKHEDDHDSYECALCRG